jgi:hypothetical protein
MMSVRQAEQAQHLITAAKQMRKSSARVVRRQIYSNQNLTLAETEFVYTETAPPPKSVNSSPRRKAADSKHWS